jgi:uncharacterized coiled-coil protein SlyX
MRVRNKIDPATEMVLVRCHTPHACTLVIQSLHAGVDIEVELTVDDLVEMLTECEMRLKDEVKYFQYLLDKTSDLKTVLKEVVSSERQPPPPI